MVTFDVINVGLNTVTALAVVYASRQLAGILVSLREEIAAHKRPNVT